MISILNFYINIKFIFIDIERNSEIGGEQSPLLKQLLELVAREKARINDKKTNDEIAARAIEFVNEGINNCPLSLNTNFRKQYQKYLQIFIIYIHSHSTKDPLITNDMDTLEIGNYRQRCDFRRNCIIRIGTRSSQMNFL